MFGDAEQGALIMALHQLTVACGDLEELRLEDWAFKGRAEWSQVFKRDGMRIIAEIKAPYLWERKVLVC